MALYDAKGNTIAVGGSGESPLAGKRICLIGDSNTQYSGDEIKAYLEDAYGCTFVPLGYAGATWETTAGADATDNSAVGRVNAIVAAADSNKLITEYDGVFIMMGTNCSTVGAVEDTSERVDTMCGAVRYCLEKLCYYGRKIALGVILPVRRSDETGSTLPVRFQHIKQIAEEFSVPVLDLYNAGRVIPDSMTPDGANYYLGDSVHFGANGTIQVKRILGKWMAYGL